MYLGIDFFLFYVYLTGFWNTQHVVSYSQLRLPFALGLSVHIAHRLVLCLMGKWIFETTGRSVVVVYNNAVGPVIC